MNEKLYHITNGYTFRRNDFTITEVDVVSRTPKSYKVNCHDRKVVSVSQLDKNLSVNGLDMYTTDLERAFQKIYDMYKKNLELAIIGYESAKRNLKEWEDAVNKYVKEESMCFNLEK